MASLAWLVAHGGIPGAIVESLVALAVLSVIVAVWLRERRGGDEAGVEQQRGHDDRGSERSDPEPGEAAPDPRHGDPGEDERVSERA